MYFFLFKKILVYASLNALAQIAAASFLGLLTQEIITEKI
jgi:hypothetical protein